MLRSAVPEVKFNLRAATRRDDLPVLSSLRKPPMGPAMVFKVEAKTALAEARCWVRIARGRLEELSKESEQPQALSAMAESMSDMQANIEAIEHRLSHVDSEWRKLYQPTPSRSAIV